MNPPSVTIKQTDDFEITGEGTSIEWAMACPVELTRIQHGPQMKTTARMLYSATGIYFLMECEDGILTCTKTEDFDNLFLEDVVEVFLQPERRHPVYLEYEASPLQKELPILVSNNGNGFYGWLPWNYRDARKCHLLTSVRGGYKQPFAPCSGWSAEFFIPFALMAGLTGAPPVPGSLWHGNLYRIDYDNGEAAHYAWAPVSGASFHDIANFGLFHFA